MNTSPLTQVEMAIGRPLSPEEQDHLDLYRKGRDLANLTAHPGWDVVMETLETIKNDTIHDLLHRDEYKPGNPDQVIAQHAVAWGVTAMYEEFKRAVQAAIECPPPQFAEEVHPDTL